MTCRAPREGQRRRAESPGAGGASGRAQRTAGVNIGWGRAWPQRCGMHSRETTWEVSTACILPHGTFTCSCSAPPSTATSHQHLYMNTRARIQGKFVIYTFTNEVYLPMTRSAQPRDQRRRAARIPRLRGAENHRWLGGGTRYPRHCPGRRAPRVDRVDSRPTIRRLLQTPSDYERFKSGCLNRIAVSTASVPLQALRTGLRK